MAQFDYYLNPNPASQEWAPYIVDLQHEMLSTLQTRVLAPLLLSKPDELETMRRLNPIVGIEGQNYFLSTAEMAAVPVRELAEPQGNLSEYRSELLAAVDLLFTAV